MARVEVDDGMPFEPDTERASSIGAVGVFGVAGLARVASVRAATLTERRRRITRWAHFRELEVSEAEIVSRVEGIEVRMPIDDVTGGSALLRAVAITPAATHVEVEPSTRLDRWLRRGCATGDSAFDARFRVRAADDVLAARLVDPSVRAVLLGFPGWVRATYDDGRIAIELDDVGAMCGARILEGMTIARAIARTNPLPGIYR